VILALAFPEVAANACANFAASPRSCAQFFEDANVGAAFVVAAPVFVAGATVDVVAAGADEADFFFDPPQPAASTTKAATKTDRSLNRTTTLSAALVDGRASRSYSTRNADSERSQLD
jgi:hypothetical protein